MIESHESVLEEGFTAAVAFLEKSRRSDDGRLHLAVAEAFALVDRHFAVAGPLEAAQLIVLFCSEESGNSKVLLAVSRKHSNL